MISLTGTFAQTNSKPLRLLVMEDVVIPNRLSDYEKAQKAMNEFIAEKKLDVNWNCYQTDEFVFMYVVPFSTFSWLDSLYKMWNEKFASVSQGELNQHMNNFVGTIESTNSIVVKKSENSSYQSTDPYVKPGDVKFMHWDFFEIIHGKEKEAWALAKEYSDITKKHNAGQDYNAWSIDFGDHSSTMIFSTPSASDVDFYTQMHQDEKKVGTDTDALFSKFMACVHKFTHINGKPRPDLSIPAGKM